SNMRLFETTGVGSCLITDWKQNINDLFEPDREVVTYRSSSECIEKVKWLLSNPLEAEKIAKAGQHRTLKDHTFDIRSVQLDLIIQEALKYSY
ncbi:MAG: glycosyltransferase, partial [Pseudanabaena sp.]